MLKGSRENIEERLRAYRTILEANRDAYEKLKRVSEGGNEITAIASKKAYETALKTLDDFFPLLTNDKPKK